jgi:S-DNA-T family DNA segregation ATPase FtsK/SpoIIIE
LESYYDYVSSNYDIKGTLPFVIGEAFNGSPIILDMATNPHLLVAGSTGSGKSVLLHTLIVNALKRDDVELYLSDTKKVEFNIYNSEKFSDHVMIRSFDYNSTLDMLNYIHGEMERRYTILSKYEPLKDRYKKPSFSKMLIIIDEVSDLMLFDKNKVFEDVVVKLAQKARAVGIFIVLATQRPSVDVLTGLIKANFPARISFKVSSKIDSRVILDATGAESLAGKGDAIINNSVYNYTRFQSAFINQLDIAKNY